jgi:prepilin-type N-terminal cleavage/methylation domain-containing protein
MHLTYLKLPVRERPLTQRANSGSRGGVTLVELLCVLGLLAILLGILMPVVSVARERARTSLCSNNLARIHQGLTAYASDFNGYLPRGYRSELGEPHFGAAVARYLGATMPLTWDGIAAVKTLKCPSSAKQDASTTYVINAVWVGQTIPFEQMRGAHKWTKIDAVRDRLPLLIDSPVQGIGRCFRCLFGDDDIYCEQIVRIKSPADLDPTAPCPRAGHDAHGKERCNVLFASGRVELVNLAQIPFEQWDDGIRD